MLNPIIATMIRVSGRAWWQVRYFSGKVLSEWDTLEKEVRLPIGAGRSSRWEEISKFGIVGIRLLCPNGLAGELEGPLGTKFIQLKSGGVDVAMGFTSNIKGMKRFCDAYIIGAISNGNGDCICRAWETKERRLIRFQDNVLNMKYRNIGRLNLDIQGVKL